MAILVHLDVQVVVEVVELALDVLLDVLVTVLMDVRIVVLETVMVVVDAALGVLANVIIHVPVVPMDAVHVLDVQEHVPVVPMAAVPVQVVLDVVHVQVVHHAQDVVHLVIDNAHLGAWDVQDAKHLVPMDVLVGVIINVSPLVMPVQGVQVDVHQIVKILVLQVAHQLVLVHVLVNYLVQ